jgi:hypothetical protein
MSPAVRGAPSPLRGEYPCTNGCGLVFAMPGSPVQHLQTCATSIEQLRRIGGAENTPDDECWLWPGLSENERRKLRFRSPVTGSVRRRYVYVIAWILVTGNDPEAGEIKPLVCHTCDDGRCFNPQHLFNCTTRENAIDMTQKGRGKPGFQTMSPERRALMHAQRGKRGYNNG